MSKCSAERTQGRESQGKGHRLLSARKERAWQLGQWAASTIREGGLPPARPSLSGVLACVLADMVKSHAHLA